MVGRLADTLDYFLLYLTGPERKGLKVGGGVLLGGGQSCGKRVHV